MRDIRSWLASARAPSQRNQEAIAMCRVLNKHHAGLPKGAVYIGRGPKWGNPFAPTATATPSSQGTSAGSPASTNCCAPSTSCAARTWCASARRVRATAISCCGSPARRARSASHGGARPRDRRAPAGPSHRLPLQTSCPLANAFRQDSLAYRRFERCPIPRSSWRRKRPLCSTPGKGVARLMSSTRKGFPSVPR